MTDMPSWVKLGQASAKLPPSFRQASAKHYIRINLDKLHWWGVEANFVLLFSIMGGCCWTMDRNMKSPKNEFRWLKIVYVLVHLLYANILLSKPSIFFPIKMLIWCNSISLALSSHQARYKILRIDNNRIFFFFKFPLFHLAS